MAPKRKATKTEQTAVISQDANEKIIETKKPNKKTASKKNAKPEIEVGNDDNVDISPKKANQRPKRENAKKVISYVEESVEETIEPVKKRARGKKAPADSVEKNDNSENNKHVANNSTQDDGNKKKSTTDDVKEDKEKLNEITEKNIDASPEKKSVKRRKAIKKEEKKDVVVKKSPAKEKKKRPARMISIEPSRRPKQTARMSTGGKPKRLQLASRRDVGLNEKSDDISENFWNDDEHEPRKEETVKKSPAKELQKRPARMISIETSRRPKQTERMSTGGKTIRYQLASRRDVEIQRRLNEKSDDISENFSSDDEHEPRKEETVQKSRKRSAEESKPNFTAVTKRIKNQKITSEDKAKPKQKMNSTTTDYTKINFESDKEYTLKICSWNVAGLRALVAKSGFEYFEHEKPDIICLQEIKCLEDEVPSEAKLPGYHMYWCSKPGGRSGVALLTKKMPYNIEYNIGDDEFDEEGRIITAEYSKFYLIVVYVPNAGRKLVNLERRLRWNKLFEQHVNKLKAIKPVAIVGDMNVAHNEIDLANPKTNTKNAGFSIEERNGMSDLLSHGFIDTFRHLYPEQKNAYTFWSYMGGARAKNVGWRLDYGIVTENLASKVVDNIIRSEILGSDHCPMLLLMNL